MEKIQMKNKGITLVALVITIIILLILAGITISYTNADGFCLNGDRQLKEYHNCVFLSKVGGYNGEISNTEIKVYNCVFTKGANSLYTGYPTSGLAINCASASTVIEPANGTKETCLTNITVDENYNITTEGWKNTGTGTNPDGTQANIGVYGGKYSW